MQHEEGLRKWSRKKCGLGVLQTSKTSSACRRKHDSVVLLDSRKSLILDVFWSSIFEPLEPSCAENTVFLGCLKINSSFYLFYIILISQNGTKNQWKINSLGHLAPRWLQGGVILSQLGSRGTHPRRCSLILHHFDIDFEVDFLSGCIGAQTF